MVDNPAPGPPPDRTHHGRAPVGRRQPAEQCPHRRPLETQRNSRRLARTTDEALTLLDKRRTYGAIVSDWGRTEKGTRISNAGRRFAESARERGIDAPIIIYTSMFGPADTRREEALQAGATFVTGSTTQLLGELTTLGLLPA